MWLTNGCNVKKAKRKAFTLAELLVAMGVLGVISTFTLAKVFYAFQEDKQILLYKDTVITINNLMWEGHQTNQLRETATGPEIIAYFQNRIGAAKICATDATTEGCTSPPLRIYDQKPGFLTYSGVGVSFHMDETIPLPIWHQGPVFELRIDLDNVSGPGLRGTDTFYLACWTDNEISRRKFQCFPSDDWEDGTMWTKAFVDKKTAGSVAWIYYPD